MGGEDWFGGLKKILLFLFCVRLRAVPWEARRGRQSPQSWSYGGWGGGGGGILWYSCRIPTLGSQPPCCVFEIGSPCVSCWPGTHDVVLTGLKLVVFPTLASQMLGLRA